MRRLAVAIAITVGVPLTGLVAEPAKAASPTVVPFSGSFTVTDVCPGITIEATYAGRDIVLEETDELLVLHEDVVTTFEANGKTLTDNDHFNLQLDLTSGVSRNTGVVFNIQAPGVGNVLMDVGILVFDENDNVIFQGGPHPGFYGDVEGFCAYFADP